jgi:predicted kinase
MEALMFIGIPASGKTSFYAARFMNTHVRISRDLLRTRRRVRRLMDFCFETTMPFVLDNTNINVKTRAPYISLIKEHGTRLVGYYFAADIGRSLAWNAGRANEVPRKAIFSMYKDLELPHFDEGFDALYYVKGADGAFSVEDWKEGNDAI